MSIYSPSRTKNSRSLSFNRFCIVRKLAFIVTTLIKKSFLRRHRRGPGQLLILILRTLNYIVFTVIVSSIFLSVYDE